MDLTTVVPSICQAGSLLSDVLDFTAEELLKSVAEVVGLFKREASKKTKV